MGDEYPRLGGVARRLIDLRREDEHRAVGWLEDDFHHFGITLKHDAGIITDLRVLSVRLPFSTCPAADMALRPMIGQRLRERCSEVGLMVPMRQQCTHMFDLAGLTMAHTASGRAHRRYEATTTDREIVAWIAGNRRMHGAGTARLLLDGELVLEWQIDRHGIVGPGDWQGQSLTSGFRQRTEAMPVELAEHATVLRRAVMIAGGRSLDPDRFATARDRGQSGACHTFLEENRDAGLRIFGSTENYEKSSEGMLSHLAQVP